MKIKFLGATERVSGSCSWMKCKRTRTEFLVDCGMIQGEEYESYENSRDFPFSPHNIKFVLLTHAHLDHCGLIPRLYKEGFKGKVFCTNATAKLAKEILYDSARQINSTYSNQDVSNINFESIDLRNGFKWTKPISVDKDISIYFQRSAHILGSASIGVIWKTDNEESNSILFSGDIGNNTEENSFQPLLKYRQKPYETLQNIVIESTYGNREHNHEELSFDYRINLLEKYIKQTLLENNGQLIIPTFSMHRTQEILFDLYYLFEVKWKKSPITISSSLKKIVKEEGYEIYLSRIQNIDVDTLKNLYEKKDNKYHLKEVNFTKNFDLSFPVDVVYDSKLAKNISLIYAKELCHKEYNQKDNTYKYPYRNHQIKEWLSLEDEAITNLMTELYSGCKMKVGIHSIKHQDVEFTSQRARVVITSSGMCDNGPVLGHLKRTLQDEKNTILLTGYQSPNTNGYILQELSQLGLIEKSNKFIQLKDERLYVNEIKANIKKIGGYFGHTDQKGLVEYLFTDNDKQYTVPNIFLNHGNKNARISLKEAIENNSKSLQEKHGDMSLYKTNVTIPKINNGFYDLDKQCWFEDFSMKDEILRLQNSVSTLITKVDQLNNKVNEVFS